MSKKDTYRVGPTQSGVRHRFMNGFQKILCPIKPGIVSAIGRAVWLISRAVTTGDPCGKADGSARRLAVCSRGLCSVPTTIGIDASFEVNVSSLLRRTAQVERPISFGKRTEKPTGTEKKIVKTSAHAPNESRLSLHRAARASDLPGREVNDV